MTGLSDMPLHVDVVTIEREVYSASDVDMVIAPGIEGELGMLPRHEPVITALKEGVLQIVRGDERDVLAIGGGFLEMRHNQVVILADVAEQADEIDIARAEAARERAQQALKEAPQREGRRGRAARHAPRLGAPGGGQEGAAAGGGSADGAVRGRGRRRASVRAFGRSSWAPRSCQHLLPLG